MPATPARIGFIQSEFRRVTSSSETAQDRHGALARKSEDPIETYFDNVADAQVVCTARQALLSPERRRFRVSVTSIDEVLALNYMGAVPLGRYRDSERAIDRTVLVSEIAIDLGAHGAELTVWG